MTAHPVADISQPTFRLINSRVPTVGIFDDLDATEAEIRAGIAFEALTNDRLSPIAGDRLRLLPAGSLLTGPTATLAMAAFLHPNPDGGRFTDGRLGAWYAALDLDTAIAEVRFHNHRRLALSDGGFPGRIQVRQLIGAVSAQLVDIRPYSGFDPQFARKLMNSDVDTYPVSQAFGTACRWPASGDAFDGIVYPSARRTDGENVCVFQPRCIHLPVNQGDHYEIVWNRQGDSQVNRLVQVA